MPKMNIEQKEKRLKDLEKEIKEEKRKLNELLGKEVINCLALEYGKIDTDKINELCEVLKTHYQISSNG